MIDTDIKGNYMPAKLSFKQEMDILFESKDNPGVMIALFPSYDVAKQLYIKGGEDIDELHVTVIYIGKMSTLTDVQMSAVLDACSDVSKNMPPIDGSFGGIGRFNASETSDGLDVFYASYDAAPLTQLRSSLASKLSASSVPFQQKHGFTPHCTLKYIQQNESLPYPRLKSEIPSKMEYLTVAAGKTRIPFQFRG